MANKTKNSKSSFDAVKLKSSSKLDSGKKTSKTKSSSSNKKNQHKNSLNFPTIKTQRSKEKSSVMKKNGKSKTLEQTGKMLHQVPSNPIKSASVAAPSNLTQQEQLVPNHLTSNSSVVHNEMYHPKSNYKKKSASSLTRLNRSVINVIRTTQRNNINLKHIADNKANILMSINALMITLLFPIILANRELIVEMRYYVPLGVLAITCLVTIVLSALVLRPFSNRGRVMRKMTEFREKSPFFFENYDRMEVEEYYDYFCTVSQDEETFFKYVIEDLHYYGKILSLKYTQVKHAYTGFIIGIILTAVTMLAVSLIYGR